ncbi:MAG: VgrG-related protein [Chloroflexota bacterium]
MPEAEIGGRVVIKVDGQALQETVQNSLLEVIVDQHAHLPHMFTIELDDPKLSLLDNGPFDLTKVVEITAKVQDSGQFTITKPLIKGEITALEPRFEEGRTAKLVVRGYDKSHRLYRETKSKAYLNIKDSDIASQCASSAGLSAQIDATNTVYEHIYQDNQSDLTFLMQRAWRIGYECFVDDGKLYFRKPPTDSAQVTLEWGTDLISFLPRVTLAEQVNEVIVKGWDVSKQQAIVGQAKKGSLYPKIGDSKDGAAWAAPFGQGKLIIVDQPVVSQAEADTLAKARLDECSGAFIDAEGIAEDRPDIRAGQIIELDALGKRLSGSYLVTHATHTYNIEKWRTTFAVRGTRTGMLAEQVVQQEPMQRWPGVVTAVVTNTNDPNDWGRVKIKYPWMTDDAESFWARVIGNGAGPEAGFYLIPDVGDEVLVAFEHGDFNYPCILGGVWNGKNAIPPEAASGSSGERPLIRTWHSRNGHYMAMYDNADQKIEVISIDGHNLLFDDANKKVELQTSGGHTVTMDDQGKKIEIKSAGGQKITMEDSGAGKITIQSNGDVQIKSGMNMKLEAGLNLDLQAGAIVNIKGSLIKLN